MYETPSSLFLIFISVSVIYIIWLVSGGKIKTKPEEKEPEVEVIKPLETGSLHENFTQVLQEPPPIESVSKYLEPEPPQLEPMEYNSKNVFSKF